MQEVISIPSHASVGSGTSITVYCRATQSPQDRSPRKRRQHVHYAWTPPRPVPVTPTCEIQLLHAGASALIERWTSGAYFQAALSVSVGVEHSAPHAALVTTEPPVGDPETGVVPFGEPLGIPASHEQRAAAFLRDYVPAAPEPDDILELPDDLN